MSKLLTREEAAVRLRLHVNTVDRLARKGVLPKLTISGASTVRFRLEDVDNLFKDEKQMAFAKETDTLFAPQTSTISRCQIPGQAETFNDKAKVVTREGELIFIPSMEKGAKGYISESGRFKPIADGNLVVGDEVVAIKSGEVIAIEKKEGKTYRQQMSEKFSKIKKQKFIASKVINSGNASVEPDKHMAWRKMVASGLKKKKGFFSDHKK